MAELEEVKVKFDKLSSEINQDLKSILDKRGASKSKVRKNFCSVVA